MDNYTMVIPTVGETGHTAGDQLLVGLGRRPTALYTQDQHVMSSKIQPPATEVVASASNNSYLFTE